MADIQKDDSSEKTVNTDENTQKEAQTVEGQKTEEVTPKADEKDYEPEVRQSPWTNRDERNKFFAEKNKGKKESEEEGQKDEEDGEQPDPRYMTKKDFQDLFTPLRDTFNEQSINSGVTSYLTAHPEMVKYEAKAIKYLKVHTTVPIADAFKTLAFDEAQALGAEKGEESKDKNIRRKIGGTSSRPSSTVPDFKGMSDKEFDEVKDRIAIGEKISVE